MSSQLPSNQCRISANGWCEVHEQAQPCIIAPEPPSTEEWDRAWKAFYEACKKLHELADRDGDIVKIDVKLKLGGGRKRS